MIGIYEQNFRSETTKTHIALRINNAQRSPRVQRIAAVVVALDVARGGHIYNILFPTFVVRCPPRFVEVWTFPLTLTRWNIVLCAGAKYFMGWPSRQLESYLGVSCTAPLPRLPLRKKKCGDHGSLFDVLEFSIGPPLRREAVMYLVYLILQRILTHNNENQVKFRIYELFVKRWKIGQFTYSSRVKRNFRNFYDL